MSIASQNSLSEHSFEGVPASLYINLPKSVPDPLLNDYIVPFEATIYRDTICSNVLQHLTM